MLYSNGVLDGENSHDDVYIEILNLRDTMKNGQNLIMKILYLKILFIALFIIGCASPPKKLVDLSAFNPKSLENWIMVKKVTHPKDDSREIRFFINKNLDSVNLAMIETEEGKIITYHYNEGDLLHSYSLNVRTDRLEAILIRLELLTNIKMWMRQAEVSYYVNEQAIGKKESWHQLEYEAPLQESREGNMSWLRHAADGYR